VALYIFLATWEDEIRRIMVQDLPWANISRDFISKINRMKSLEVWLKQ
jgi:hypothetical protein